MNRVNENTASALDGAEPRCSQRGVLSTFFLQALIPLAICYLCWQIMIDPRCLSSAEEAKSLQSRISSGTEGIVHSAFLSSLQVQSTIVVNETEENFGCFPSTTESMQPLSRGGSPWDTCATSTRSGSVLQIAKAAGFTTLPGTEGALQTIPNYGDQTGNHRCCPEPARHPAQTISSQALPGTLGPRVSQDDDDAVASMSSCETKVCDPIITQEHLNDASVCYDPCCLSSNDFR